MEGQNEEKKEGQVVAIKIYERIKLIDRIKREIVKREIEILSKIGHPNIIELLKTKESS